MLPASRESFANTTSETLTAALAAITTFQTTSTVRSCGARSTRSMPSRTSLQCPRDSDSSDWRRRAGMRATRTAENEERHGVDPVRRIRAGRREDHARDHRADDPGEVLDADQQRVRLRQIVLVGDEVRQARIHGRAEEAGRDPGHGRERDERRRRVHERERAEDAARTRSAATISRRRWKRSTSGPSTSPITTIGKKSATRRAATQRPGARQGEDVRAVSATAARYVPNAEPALARKSSLKWCPRRRRFRRPETRTRGSLDRDST